MLLIISELKLLMASILSVSTQMTGLNQMQFKQSFLILMVWLLMRG